MPAEIINFSEVVASHQARLDELTDLHVERGSQDEAHNMTGKGWDMGSIQDRDIDDEVKRTRDHHREFAASLKRARMQLVSPVNTEKIQRIFVAGD
jgi:hypothetical protein